MNGSLLYRPSLGAPASTSRAASTPHPPRLASHGRGVKSCCSARVSDLCSLVEVDRRRPQPSLETRVDVRSTGERPSSDLQELCTLQLELLHNMLRQSGRTLARLHTTVYSRAGCSLNTGAALLQKVASYPAPCTSHAWESNFSNDETLVLSLDESWLSEAACVDDESGKLPQDRLLVLPQSGSIVLPLVEQDFLVGLLVVEPEVPSSGSTSSDAGPSDSVSTMDSYRLMDSKDEDASMWDSLSQLKDEVLSSVLLMVAPLLSKACAMDLKAVIRESQVAATSMAAQEILQDAQRPLSGLNTFTSMLLPRLKEGDPDLDMAKGIVMQGKRLSDLVWQLDAALLSLRNPLNETQLGSMGPGLSSSSDGGFSPSSSLGSSSSSGSLQRPSRALPLPSRSSSSAAQSSSSTSTTSSSLSRDSGSSLGRDRGSSMGTDSGSSMGTDSGSFFQARRGVAAPKGAAMAPSFERAREISPERPSLQQPRQLSVPGPASGSQDSQGAQIPVYSMRLAAGDVTETIDVESCEESAATTGALTSTLSSARFPGRSSSSRESSHVVDVLKGVLSACMKLAAVSGVHMVIVPPLQLATLVAAGVSTQHSAQSLTAPTGLNRPVLPLHVSLCAVALRRIASYILDICLQCTPRGGQLSVSVSAAELGSASAVCLQCMHTGKLVADRLYPASSPLKSKRSQSSAASDAAQRSALDQRYEGQVLRRPVPSAIRPSPPRTLSPGSGLLSFSMAEQLVLQAGGFVNIQYPVRMLNQQTGAVDSATCVEVLLPRHME